MCHNINEEIKSFHLPLGHKKYNLDHCKHADSKNEMICERHPNAIRPVSKEKIAIKN